MPIHRVTVIVACTFLLAAEPPVTAQIINYHADSTKIAIAADAGVSLVHWVQTTPGALEHGIFVRNISKRPIQVVSYEVYQCINILGGVCGVHAPGPVVAPGKTVRLVIIEEGPRVSGHGSYRYRVTSVFVPDSAADDASHHK